MKNMKYENLMNLSDVNFRRATGLKREIFEFEVAIVEDEYNKIHKKGGRPSNLTPADQVLLMHCYYRDYTTFLKLGIYFDLDESNAYRRVRWVESVLHPYMNEDFDITKLNNEKEHLVDVTECSTQRPKNIEIQREYYSGKKKKHTVKILIIIEADTKKIVFVSFEKGSVHDFQLYKDSTENIDEDTAMIGDSGFQGLDKLLNKAITPKKKSKNNPLTDEDKELNHLISTIRISIEHVNCQLKFFRILSERYRNRKDTFKNRALYLCSIYNLSLVI